MRDPRGSLGEVGTGTCTVTASKIAGAIGLCRRAGHCAAGAWETVDAIKRGKAAIVLLAADAGDNTVRRVAVPADAAGVPVRRIPLTKKEIAALWGQRANVTCVAIPQKFLNLVLASL